MPAEQPGEEFLCQLACGVVLTAPAAEESKDRLVVGLAQLAERFLSFGRFAPRAED